MKEESAVKNPGHGARTEDGGGLDLIGDIHGYADELAALLARLGYQLKGGGYRHSERRAVFLGDLIDRGPKIRATLRIVRPMVESGAALAMLGNHEFNAVCMNTPDGAGGFLRPRTPTSLAQHGATMEQFKDAAAEWTDHLRWFKSLPLFLELGPLRAVHASWHKPSVERLRGRTLADDGFLRAAADRVARPDAFRAAETTLKGVEARLPQGVTLTDKDGHLRRETRLGWWRDPRECRGLRDWAFPFHEELDEGTGLTDGALAMLTECGGQRDDGNAYFFGHYWMKPGPPRVFGNMACLDHSVARGGFLTAYRWDGELRLDPGKFVTFPDWDGGGRN